MGIAEFLLWAGIASAVVLFLPDTALAKKVG
jgi:hypothetical protein